MAHSFYPFVENPGDEEDSQNVAGEKEDELVVRYPARIAVYDDQSAAPRVVVVEPKDVRPYLEEITQTVTKLAKEQGGDIPFMVIREIVENFIHAYFIEPTISILDGGCTLRFSDQGPGIPEKLKALEYGSSSATEEMKQFIRGVGSGLPYAQQYMVDRGGTLTIEDNMAGGTIVTVSTIAEEEEPLPMMGGQFGQPQYAYPQQGGWNPQLGYGYQQPNPYSAAPGAVQGMQQMPAGYPTQQVQYGAYAQPQGQPMYPQQFNPMQGAGAMGGMGGQYPGAMQQPMPQPMGQPVPQGQPGVMGGAMPGAGVPGAPMAGAPMAAPAPVVSERGMLVLNYLAHNEAVGPSDLMRAYGSSQPTWSRELTALEQSGLVHKRRGEQKRVLTDAGRAYLAQLFS